MSVEVLEYQLTLNEKERTFLGAYYTPDILVQQVFELIKDYKNPVIFDPAAGDGAFLNIPFKIKRIIANEIDINAFKLLQRFNVELFNENFLSSPSRFKYKIKEEEFLIIIGNPPYNDRTSKNKRHLKVNTNYEIDKDLKTRDIGISFFRAFNKLNANVVCVLHPLSYLIKETNFRLLEEFKDNYTLKRGIIFSSELFKTTGKTPFPIMIGLYEKGDKMNYSYIYNFEFEILNSDKKFVLKNFETIDGYINKYPPRKNDVKKSDIGLYMFTIRDLNSLLTTGNLTEKEDFNNHITIHYKDLYKYAYLNCMKRYFRKHYLFGNLSPLVNKNDLENNKVLQDLFIIDTIINNQFLSCFNKNNKDSIIWTKKLNEEFNKDYEPYKTFIKFINNKFVDTSIIAKMIKEYFDTMIKDFI